MRFFKTFILFILSLNLSSCYCFKKSNTKSSVRDLEVKHTKYSLCEGWGGGGRSSQVKIYHGLLKQYNHLSKEGYKVTGALPYKCPFGIEFENYIAPPWFNYSVLGIGADLSYNKEIFVGENQFPNQTELKSYRFMLSTNYMTLVKRSFVGYLSIQNGVKFTHENFKTGTTNYYRYTGRIAYGIQYYFPSYPMGLNIEVGYGAGSLGRIGLFIWLFKKD